MKKILAFILAGCVAMSVMAACSSKDESSSETTETETTETTETNDVKSIAEIVGETVTFDKEIAVSEDYVEWLGIPTENVKAYAGKYCSSGDGDSFNIVLVLEAADGAADDVKSAVESKRDSIVAENELYSEETVERLSDSVIYENGNYIVWATCGDSADYDAVQAAIDSAF